MKLPRESGDHRPEVRSRKWQHDIVMVVISITSEIINKEIMKVRPEKEMECISLALNYRFRSR
jgi:hypothetical protein